MAVLSAHLTDGAIPGGESSRWWCGGSVDAWTCDSRLLLRTGKQHLSSFTYHKRRLLVCPTSLLTQLPYRCGLLRSAMCEWWRLSYVCGISTIADGLADTVRL